MIKIPKIIHVLLLLSMLQAVACNSKNKAENSTEIKDTAAIASTPEQPHDTEQNAEYLVASGFEPMWSLRISKGKDDKYPVVFEAIDGKMTGILNLAGANTFEGIVSNDTGKEKDIKVIVRDAPCTMPSGEVVSKSVTVILDKAQLEGCGRAQ